MGEEHPGPFFQIIVEALSDSFDPAQVAAYEDLMRVWIPRTPRAAPVIPDRVDTVFVLSRVTLGSDIKITGVILDALKKRFPDAAITLVGSRKCAELFAADPRLTHLEAGYPRAGPVSSRVEFAHNLRRRLEIPHRIVVDPDSRITQLGLVPLCEPERYFHFPSRTANSAPNLTELTQNWVAETFGQTGQAYIAPAAVPIQGGPPIAAVSLGVGGNEAKRISAGESGDFESGLIAALAKQCVAIWLDRGAGGDEARRVTEAATRSGAADRVRFWEGSFAGFASIISQAGLYCGYDSAGQHAAAAAGTPLVTFFAGAPSDLFRARWAPRGPGPVRVIMESEWTSQSLESILAAASN